MKIKRRKKGEKCQVHDSIHPPIHISLSSTPFPNNHSPVVIEVVGGCPSEILSTKILISCQKGTTNPQSLSKIPIPGRLSCGHTAYVQFTMLLTHFLTPNIHNLWVFCAIMGPVEPSRPGLTNTWLLTGLEGTLHPLQWNRFKNQHFFLLAWSP